MGALAADPALTLQLSSQVHKERAGKYLIFGLADEEFGASVFHVREIMGMQRITPVPQMPAHVKGVMNLRGRVVPVIDLRLKFGMAGVAYTERTCIVLMRSLSLANALSLGIVVDRVSEVVSLAAEEIEDMAAMGAMAQTSCALGIAKAKGKVRILLEIDELLQGMHPAPPPAHDPLS